MGKTKQAIEMRMRAGHLERVAAAKRSMGADGLREDLAARKLQADAEELLEAPDDIVRAAGEAVTGEPSGDDDHHSDLVDTLKHPDMIGLDASRERLKMLSSVDALETGLDVAESIKPKDALERMLAHQLASLHGIAMKLMAQALAEEVSPSEGARLTIAATKALTTFQTGYLALNRVRNSGHQTIVVQHVQISPGGQAIVAGSMQKGHKA